MKRLFLSLFALVFVAMVLAPVQFVVSDQGIKTTKNVASADTGVQTCVNDNEDAVFIPIDKPCPAGYHVGDPLKNYTKCPDGTKAPGGDYNNCAGVNSTVDNNKKCVKLSVPLVEGLTCADNTGEGGAIFFYLKLVLRFLSGAVGMVIVLMLVIAGIQYITSAGDPGAIKAAKDRVVNAITALVLFVLSYAILSFVIPGGIFG
jgi:hypothetical protein